MTTATAAPPNGAPPPVAPPTGLEFVQPGAAPKTQNVLLYGPPGSGKSTGAATAPGPILWLNAEGENALRFAREHTGADIREVEVKGPETLDAAYIYLRDGNGIKTVVVDSLGEVYRVVLERLAGGGTPQIQHYGDVNTKLERFFRTLRDLPVNVVLLAHEEIADLEGIPTRRPVTGGKKLPEQVMAQMDHVGYTGVTAATEDQPAKYVAQLVEAHGRRAKNRGGKLGDFPEVNLTEWIAIATASTNKGAKKS